MTAAFVVSLACLVLPLAGPFVVRWLIVAGHVLAGDKQGIQWDGNLCNERLPFDDYAFRPDYDPPPLDSPWYTKP
jgi:hypothetical protein